MRRSEAAIAAAAAPGSGALVIGRPITRAPDPGAAAAANAASLRRLGPQNPQRDTA